MNYSSERDVLVREIREALAHLYDHAYLETHALAERLAGYLSGGARTRAQELRRLLLDAIELLNPGDSVPRRAVERRAYTILFDLYVEGKEVGDIAADLGIGLRQLRRDRAAALEALATILADRYLHSAASSNASYSDADLASTGESSADTLRLESLRLAQQWDDIRLDQFFDRLILLLEGLAQEHAVAIASNVSRNVVRDTPTVQANSTLLRQVLLSLCSQLITRTGPEQIVFEAVAGADEQAVGLHLFFAAKPSGDAGPSSAPDASLRNLEGPGVDGTIETMIAAMGATLVYEPPMDQEQRIWLRLGQDQQWTVLVVDDNEELFMLFQRLLTGHPYRLIHAENVDDAFELVEKMHPDIILLDLMMPDKDGWELLQALRQEPSHRSVPVIICSVLHEPALAHALGAAYYLKKPVTANDLLQALAAVREQV